MVRKVKRSEAGMIQDPVTLPTATLEDAERLMREYRIGGLPVVDVYGRLLGLVTNRDLRFERDLKRPVTEVMTPVERLVTARPGTTLEEAEELLRRHKVEKLPLVDESGRLKGLITLKDIVKRRQYPNAVKDAQGRLLVGAAVGASKDLPEGPRPWWRRGWTSSSWTPPTATPRGSWRPSPTSRRPSARGWRSSPGTWPPEKGRGPWPSGGRTR